MAPQVGYHMLQGPSVLAPWPAIVAEFPAPPYRSLAAGEIEPALRDLLSSDLFALVTLPLPDGAFETIAGAIAIALQDAGGPSGLAFRSTRSASGQCRVLVGFHDPAVALPALQAGLEAAQALFRRRAGRPVDPAAARAAIQRSVAAVTRQPDPLARSLMRVAKRRGIPVHPAALGSRVWVYGQGCHAWHFFEAASHGDAMTGSRLARNKQFSNALITRLGLPGVRHLIADSAASAKRLAQSIGYPVVIKPVDGSKGRGVTVRIADESGIDAAFAAAAKLAPSAVLVEGWVAGDDHRLAVVAGRFAWAVRRSPPRVTADGEHTVRELVERENARRRAAPDRDLAGARIALDAEAEALVASEGYSLDARPPAGTVVALGLVANQARGGTITDCTDAIHADNRAMAETIARAFHLDTTGIDFMTPDITRSWRDVPCAVIEINVTPGFSSDARAELIIGRRFAPGTNGRVPCVLLVGAGPADLAAVATALAAGGRTVGSTDGSATRVGDDLRFTGDALLPDRALALVLDPACEAIVIAATTAEIATHGLPLDRFDVAVAGADAELSPATLALLRDCCGSVREAAGQGRYVDATLQGLQETPAPA